MSNVDPTVPAVTSGIALTADLRKNFATIKAELEIIQIFLASGSIFDSPQFTGTASFAKAQFNDTVSFLNNPELIYKTVVPTLAGGNTNVSSTPFAIKLGRLVMCRYDILTDGVVAALCYIPDAAWAPMGGGSSLVVPIGNATALTIEYGIITAFTYNSITVPGATIQRNANNAVHAVGCHCWITA